jgi:OPT family oligopeptide transporter
MADNNINFKPFVAPESRMKEFTIKSIVLGSIFGILFGAASVYLALRAGLTVSASIPVAVIAITLGRWIFKTTILENNIIQTTGSAGESVASGVAFTLPGFLFLSIGSNGANYFDYITIFILAIAGGMLGTLMMIPLRRTLIVKEHGILPYPEGTACAAVLKAGEKGGNFAKTAFYGLGVAVVYAFLQKVLEVIQEAPVYMTQFKNKYFPSANISGEITPEYLGVGYIIGPRISGILVAGGVLSWLVLNPLLASVIQPDLIAAQLVKLGYLKDVATAGGPGGWNPLLHQFTDTGTALYRAYIRQIGAGAVAAGGFITLLKTIPTIISSFKSSISSVDTTTGEKAIVKRTEKDLNLKVVLFGSLALIVLIAVLPIIPGNTVFNKILIGILIIIFGAFFVTVASRIVGLIGSSNSPVSGMTIATILATSLLFIGIGWSGKVYEPMVLVVGGIICIAAANAGGTSQDLKTGFIVGATPKYQQLALFIGVTVSAIAVGLTVKILDTPTAGMISQGLHHAIGSDKFPAPQATLMATLIRGVQSFNLDWQFVFVGIFIAIVLELCGINSLSFAVGAYLPLSTTLPIAIGGAIKGIAERKTKKQTNKEEQLIEEDDLSRGNLFATGLVAGGAIFGVVIAILQAFPSSAAGLSNVSMANSLTNTLGAGGYSLLAVACFALMAVLLYQTARRKT